MKTLSIKLLVIFSLACVGLFAQTSDELTEQSWKLITAEKHAEALQICQKVLKTNPADSFANYACGVASFNLKKMIEAKKYLIVAEKEYKGAAEIYALLGRINYLELSAKPTFEHYFSSMQICQKATKIDRFLPVNKKCRDDNNRDYAKFLQSNAKNKQAVYESFKKAIAAKPKDTNTISIFFDLLAQLNDYKEITATLSSLAKNPMSNWDSFAKACDSVNVVRSNTNDNLSGIPALRFCADSWSKLNPKPLESENTYRFDVFSNYQRLSQEQNYNLSENADYLSDLTALINDPTAKYTYIMARFKRLDLYIYRKDFAKAEEEIKFLEGKTEDVPKAQIEFRKGKILMLRDKNIRMALRNMEPMLQDCRYEGDVCSREYFEAILFYLTNSDYKFDQSKLLEFQKNLKTRMELLDNMIPDPKKFPNIEREPYKSLNVELEKKLAETPK
jgi:hypothetical protein